MFCSARRKTRRSKGWKKKRKKSKGKDGYWKLRRWLSVPDSLLISQSPPHLEKTCSHPHNTHPHCCRSHSPTCTHTLTKPCKHPHSQFSLPHSHCLTHTNNFFFFFEKTELPKVFAAHTVSYVWMDLHTHTYSHLRRRKNYILSFDPKPFDFLRLVSTAT